MTTKVPAPRIYRLTYVGAPRRNKQGRFEKRTASSYIKVPYASLFGLMDTMARGFSTGQITSFKLEVARVITPEIRESLVRWEQALAFTTEVTAVDWSK